ncbi:uncharacterized protein LOC121657180 [Melanotaenia boesemani]|uniref:uncharacterized protein LOC121657180 n=1 Tax=Melanotaenia boesemani TaxID=1250792 RepID=UPI001C045F5F|nr:uncharacterized protein LOC121657180 [Melanotaenia boesemani]
MANITTVSKSGQSHRSSELRIVLIGGRELKGSKSSTGNFILGQNVFDTSKRTAQSVVQQRKVHGRQVTIVDTPGWWWMYTKENTPKLDQIEIQNSVHLCPPGPHAFLLVIPVDTHLPQISKKSLKEHLELFKTDVFSHTIVLLSSLAPYSDENVKSKIKRSPTLQWILQQCGNRKHVVDISNMQDGAQVQQLFEKIDLMVANNGGRHYNAESVDGNALREEMKVLAERATRRFDEVQKQRKELKKLVEGGKVPPQHLRLVILGAQWAAKSSAGNTILGRDAFDVNDCNKRTMHCEMSHGMVAERRLTVVDSPGWFYNNTLQDTSQMDKLEIENSMYMCPPGPHAVLLVIVLATAINASYQRTVQEHMSLFTDDIWKHTIILFTRGDWLGGKTVEERIESEEGLQWLVNKCGNRYHVLNNMDRSDRGQVKELLEKIEEMWAGNEAPYYEVDPDRATQIEAEIETGKKKAKTMRKITERQSRILTELFNGEMQQISNIRVVLVGRKGSGKSTAGNLILFNEMFDTDYDTSWLKKDLQDQNGAEKSVKCQGNFDGVKVTVVETPGWYIDTSVPEWLRAEVLRSVSMCSPGPHVFLLVVPILKAFTEKDHKALVELLMPFTERVWKHCMVLFTGGEWLNEVPIEEHITREGKTLQELVEKCGNRYHVFNQNHFGDPVPVKGLLQKIIDMITRNKGCFSTEGKQSTFAALFWQAKQPMMTEEEWNRREQMLIDRMLKAIANESHVSSVPFETMAHSIDDHYIPDMSGDLTSEYGSMSQFRNRRAHGIVAEWLRKTVIKSHTTSGIGSSICSSDTYVEQFDESLQINDNNRQSHRSSELRIVLIGGRELKGSKSSTGNFILGQNVFDTSKRTAQSVVQQRKVLGRQVTIVDTPGWWWGFPRENTPKLDQIEIQNSVHLCPPGPHAFLLVISVDTHLPQLSKKSLKEHLKLFKTDVFSHTIVLLSSLAPYSDENVKSKIKRNPTLQWILQQCGNRKHVVDISNMQDDAQVQQLFEKIDLMVANNGGRHYNAESVDGNALREEMKVLAERATKRFDEVQKQRKELKKLIEGGKVPPQHLRLVILGAQWAAKSSAGNTILGRDAFDVNDCNKRTMHCEISHGMVAERRLTVVDSPGWFYNNTLQDTSQMDKLEIENSMYMCPPGPHAVLLVIDLATATNASYQRTVQEHMSLFTADIWKHTIILFTRGDWLGGKTVEERIESEEGLQLLVNKCGNRYHVLNNMDRSDRGQVKELLEKIEEIWAGNEAPYYEVDPDRATQIEAEIETGKKKAKTMKKITERQSRILTELFNGEMQQISNIRVVLVGQKGSGKSTAGNLILFNEMFETDFSTAWLKKDLQDQNGAEKSVKCQGNFDGVKVTVVETPRWYIDTSVPEWLRAEVLRSVSMCSPGPHVFLLVVPILKAFTEKDHKALVELLMPFTERVWKHCMVLFTWGEWLNDVPIEEHITREGKTLQELVEKCGNRYHVLNQNHFGDPVPVKGLLQKIIDMITRNKGCFSIEGKQRKFSALFWQAKQPILTEEEWNRREQMLIDRMLKAIANEPDVSSVPSETMAHSIDDYFIPDMTGELTSEYGSTLEFRNRRAHGIVAEWLRRTVRKSHTTSGIGSSICSSDFYVEQFDESLQMDDN